MHLPLRTSATIALPMLLGIEIWAASIEELRKKAEDGEAGAQFELAAAYYEGTGVPKDTVEAVKWLRLAADQGYPRAQYGLGVLYDRGSARRGLATESAIRT